MPAKKLTDVLRERTGSLEETALFSQTRVDDPPLAKRLVGEVELSYVDLGKDSYLLRIGRPNSNSRPAHIFYDAKTDAFTTSIPNPEGAPHMLREDFAYTHAAAHLLYQDLQNT